MFRLGKNTISKLPNGILVNLLASAVALTNSITVLRRSRFSFGIFAIKDLRFETRVREAGRIPLREGSVKVDKDGGLRRFNVRGADDEDTTEDVEDVGLCCSSGF